MSCVGQVVSVVLVVRVCWVCVGWVVSVGRVFWVDRVVSVVLVVRVCWVCVGRVVSVSRVGCVGWVVIVVRVRRGVSRVDLQGTNRI